MSFCNSLYKISVFFAPWYKYAVKLIQPINRSAWLFGQARVAEAPEGPIVVGKGGFLLEGLDFQHLRIYWCRKWQLISRVILDYFRHCTLPIFLNLGAVSFFSYQLDSQNWSKVIIEPYRVPSQFLSGGRPLKTQSEATLAALLLGNLWTCKCGCQGIIWFGRGVLGMRMSNDEHATIWKKWTQWIFKSTFGHPFLCGCATHATVITVSETMAFQKHPRKVVVRLPTTKFPAPFLVLGGGCVEFRYV